MPRTTKKKAYKSKNARSIEPPPPPSLLSLPPELRNNIYHLIAEEIDEASIIGRKVNKSLLSRLYNESVTRSTLWEAVAKHPLSQTCSQIRKEFDPIHQYRVFTTMVPRYYLELENFDITLIPRFSAAISRMPSLLAHLRNENGQRPTPTIRFQLNKHAWDSVGALQERLQMEGYLANPFDQLEALKVFTENEAVFNFRNTPGLSRAQKKVGLTQQGRRGYSAVYVKLRSFADELCDRWVYGVPSRTQGHDADYNVIGELRRAYCEAQYRYRQNLRMQRQEKREQKALEAEKREQEALEAKLRSKFMEEVRQGGEDGFDSRFRKEVKWLIEEEVKRKIREEVEDELRARLMEDLKEELRGELKDEEEAGLRRWRQN